MKLLIKFPTRDRPKKFLKTLKRYYKYLSTDDVEFVINCDNDDESMKEEYVQEVLNSYKNLRVIWGDNKSKIEAINSNMNELDFDVVLLASDDMYPLKRGYDEKIKNDMEKHFPNKDGVLWYHDGHRNDINTLCILGRTYFDRFGYIYHPDYRSFFCDDEFTQVANMLNKQVYIDEILIEHKNPAWGFKEFNDKLYHNNLSHWKEDEKTFEIRKSKNFDLK